MNSTPLEILDECSQRSYAGTIAFPEVVSKLVGVGIETYHADLYRSEKTYYLPTGESHIVSTPTPDTPVAGDFCASAVADAVWASQRGEIKYVEFLRRILAAGTTQYFVYLTGKRAVYIGRDGNEHIEHFPKAP